MSKDLLLVQPGPYGDIFVCAPIAYYYSNVLGYKVYWPVRKQYIGLLSYFDYVTPIQIPEIDDTGPGWLKRDVDNIFKLDQPFDKIVNLADRGPHPRAQKPWENFEQCKYRVANVPLKYKNSLEITYDLNKAQTLYNTLVKGNPEPYTLLHVSDSSGKRADPPVINGRVIYVHEVKGFEIPDWILVIQKAKSIYCVESSFHQFVDGLLNKENITEERFLLRRPSCPTGCRYTLSSRWNLDIIGKNSRVVG